jgi:outer membrane immunogenic protein
MKKSTLFASTSLIGLLAAPAFAADLAPMPVKYREAEKLPWAGFYVGANAGYAWSSDPGVTCSFSGVAGSPCGAAVFSAPQAAGAEYGVQAGYNWQVSNYVLGLEADFNKVNAHGASQFTGIDEPGKGMDQTSSRYDWLGTARGRAGVVSGPALFYATGGFAYGRVGHQYIEGVNAANGITFGLSENQIGWTVGGGAEYALNQHWSIKAEYLYVHLGDSKLNISGVLFPGNNGTPSGTSILQFNNNLNIVRLGANYRF